MHKRSVGSRRGEHLFCNQTSLSFELLFCAFFVFAPSWSAGAESTATDIEEKLDVVYVKRGNEPVKLDAYLLTQDKPHPAVIFVHGGGFVTGDKRPCPSYIIKPYLQHGYSVISVNYRLAPQHPFPAAIDDVVTAIAFVQKSADEWRIRPDQIVLTGESAGGLISALVGATFSHEPQLAAVIPMCGEVDLELRLSEDPCFTDGQMKPRPVGGCISKGLAAFFGFAEANTDARRQVIRSASTITHLRPNMPPYLLVHGTRDYGVPYEQSVSLQQAMQRAGADCTLHPVVGGGHGNWTPKQWEEVEGFEFEWLSQKFK
jgi:acetyl esterase/lipase